MSYKKFFLTQEQADYLRRNPAKYWTNDYNGITSAQYHVEVDGVTYWLDIYDDNELINIAYADLVWNPNPNLDSDCGDVLEAEEYEQLQLDVQSAIDRNIVLDEQLRVAFAKMDAMLGCTSEVSVDNLKSFVNKLNKLAIEGATK